MSDPVKRYSVYSTDLQSDDLAEYNLSHQLMHEVIIASDYDALAKRCEELECCIREYWDATDWDEVGGADSTAAKLLPDLKAARKASGEK